MVVVFNPPRRRTSRNPGMVIVGNPGDSEIPWDEFLEDGRPTKQRKKSSRSKKKRSKRRSKMARRKKRKRARRNPRKKRKSPKRVAAGKKAARTRKSRKAKRSRAAKKTRRNPAKRKRRRRTARRNPVKRRRKRRSSKRRRTRRNPARRRSSKGLKGLIPSTDMFGAVAAAVVGQSGVVYLGSYLDNWLGKALGEKASPNTKKWVGRVAKVGLAMGLGGLVRQFGRTAKTKRMGNFVALGGILSVAGEILREGALGLKLPGFSGYKTFDAYPTETIGQLTPPYGYSGYATRASYPVSTISGVTAPYGYRGRSEAYAPRYGK